ncbi:hypothetical protein BGZ65_004507 [Modicella reniformis]|uniref:Uncharacterized protein n=1 Tax=Modicella reniformis TaxID=1440133 RepID=A0A9P6LSV3_9FUNG|nr:hypothetical protein BGZ65_004507 [Modicella reniformis]
MENTAVSLAHRYAQAAEEFREHCQWTEAMDMHFKAANQFQLATKDTQSQEVIQTLDLMSTNHMRQAKDLQRKIAKAEAAAAAAAAAAAPQQKSKGENGHGSLSRATGSSAGGGSSTPSSSSSSSGRRRGNGQQQLTAQHQHQLQQQYLQQLQQLQQGGVAGQLINTLCQELGNLEAKGMDSGTDSDHSSSSSELSSNSSIMIEELLENDSDPFYKFWQAVENLVLQISSPVAFTSIPLEGDDPTLFNTPSTTDDPSTVNPAEAPFAIPTGNVSSTNSASAKTTTLQPSGNLNQSRISRTRNHDPSSMHESFFIIDSPSSEMRGHPKSRSESTGNFSFSSSSNSGSKSKRVEPRNSSKTLEEYAIENQQLKMTLDKLSKHNMRLEKNREGLMQMSMWTKDVQRSAMQLLKSQDVLRPNLKQSIMDLSAGKKSNMVGLYKIEKNGGLFETDNNLGTFYFFFTGDKGSPLSQRAQAVTVTASAAASQLSLSSIPSLTSRSININSPVAMQARLRELEEEVIKLKLENSKLGSSMKKYKQRWEDLKESAKKRRNASSTAPSDKALDDDTSGSTQQQHRHHHHHHHQQQQPSLTTGLSPYSVASMAGNSYGNISNNSQGAPARPVSNFGRSSSASGPVLSASGSYQKRILMENRPGGLDTSPLSVHRHPTAGIVSSTSPRVLDSTSRTMTHLSPSPMITTTTNTAATSTALSPPTASLASLRSTSTTTPMTIRGEALGTSSPSSTTRPSILGSGSSGSGIIGSGSGGSGGSGGSSTSVSSLSSPETKVSSRAL